MAGQPFLIIAILQEHTLDLLAALVALTLFFEFIVEFLGIIATDITHGALFVVVFGICDNRHVHHETNLGPTF
ncbi:MAG: hypothetical protein IKV60_00475, partial [Rikenellaceae bacterium]|nr:hypothetical protein [Rikenellaceae bacterium]